MRGSDITRPEPLRAVGLSTVAPSADHAGISAGNSGIMCPSSPFRSTGKTKRPRLLTTATATRETDDGSPKPDPCTSRRRWYGPETCPLLETS